MRKFLFSAFVLLFSTALFAQTIAFWDFNSNPGDANTATGTNTVATGAGTLTLIGGVTQTYATGNPNDPNTTDNSGVNTTTYPAQGTNPKTAGIQLNVSTAGQSGIGISFWQRLSNTASNTWVLQYTLDRTAGSPVWVDAATYTFTPQPTGTGDTWYFRNENLTGITGLNNNANVAFRIVSNYDPSGAVYLSARSTSSYATNGTSRFDLITITSTPPVVPYTLAFNRTNRTVSEGITTAQVWLKVTVVGNTAGTITFGNSAYSTAINGTDYSVVATTINVPTTLALNDSISFTLNINPDVNVEADEYVIVKISNTTNVTVASTEQHTLYITDNDRVVPVANNSLSLNLLGSFSNGVAFAGPTQINSAEISAYDSLSQNIYIANSIGGKLDIVNFANPAAPVLISSINITSYGAINSVAARNGLIALAIENGTNQQDSGKVVFLDTAGVFIKQVNVGMMPDMIVFNHAGTKVYTANEGQPNDAYTVDPDGSISVVDISAGVLNATVSHITFTSYNGQEASLRALGIRIYGTGATTSKDFEPEYLTISDDDSKAWVTLQENNALAELNLSTNTVTSLIPLGYKDHSLVANALDASDVSSAVNISNFPVKGMYQPDAISHFSVGANMYLITANEGDARAYTGLNEETRVGSLTLDPLVFPNSADIKKNEVLGRLRLTNRLGDTDSDGDFDEIYSYGARSFSILNASNGSLVYDSGSKLEEITNADASFSAYFNNNVVRKDRSDDKGPEAEGVEIGTINGHKYAFVGMERTGGVIVYDVTNPASPSYVTYKNNRPTDVSPEGIVFIPASASPTGTALLILSNEISSTLTVYGVNPCTAPGIADIANVGSTTACPSADVKLYNVNSNPTYTYQWYKDDVVIANANDSIYFAGQSGSYTLVAYNAAGCVDTSSAIIITIADVTVPTITAPADITAYVDTACMVAAITLGTPITNDNCSVASVINNAPMSFAIGTTTVLWTVSDGSGNMATATQLVTVSDTTLPTITAPANVSACADSANTATVSLGTPITDDNCSVASVTNDAPATFPIGVTTVTWTVTDAFSNTQTATQTVTVNATPAAPTLTANNDTVCAGTFVTLTATDPVGQTGTEYLWYRNGVAINYGFTNTFTTAVGTTTGTNEYVVEVVYSGYNCFSTQSDTINITILSPTVSITPSGSTTFCANAPITLNATAGLANYVWKRSNVVQQSGASSSYIPTASGNHSVTVTDMYGCMKTSSYTYITRNVQPFANAGTNKNLCVGSSIQIGTTPNVNYTYAWLPTTALSNPNIANPIASPTTTTSYVVTVTNPATTCSKKDTVIVTSLALPTKPNFYPVAPGSTGIQCEGTPVTLNALPSANAASVYWYKNSVLLYIKPTAYDAVIVLPKFTYRLLQN